VIRDHLARHIARRKERIAFAASVVVGVLIVWSNLSGWLDQPDWGEAISSRRVGSPDAVKPLTAPDFAAVWKDETGDPFGAPGADIRAGGTARLIFPPLPPLRPVPPPPPTPGPLDLFKEEDP
jgi:hypothetical protein